MDIDPHMLETQNNLGQLIVTLMGTSFILGSLVTILLIMLVDYLHKRLSPDDEI